MQQGSCELEVYLARNDTDIRQSQWLRAEVFGVTHGHTNGREHDEYDRYCDHLIVRDKKKDLIVGTYRLLPSFKAKEAGYHAEKIFDITRIKKIKGNILELGRSCVHPGYRSNWVISCLWRGLADYIETHQIKFLFGCPRLDTSDIKEISRIFLFLKRNFYSPEGLRVEPLADCKIPIVEDIDEEDPGKIMRELPPLVKGYLKTGAVVCGYPALNKEFGSTVLFMLLDFSQTARNYKKRFTPH